MRLNGTLVGEIKPSQISDLAGNGVGESRLLEFKRELPGSSDEERREFLADVAAFANTSGGVIVYGVSTARDSTGRDTGIADSIVGIESLNLDATRQRLLSLLRDGVQPALTRHVSFQAIEVRSGDSLESVLVLGIERSLDRPHMVSLRGSSRFWRRSEAGKYQPDIQELRRVFLESASWIDECEAFRERRLGFVRRSSIIDGTRAVVVHILPLGRLASLIDIRQLGDDLNRSFPPFQPAGWNYRFNADGFQTFTSDQTGRRVSYTQCFRFGGLEGGSVGFMADRHRSGSESSTTTLWAVQLADEVSRYVHNGVTQLKRILGVDPPLCLMLSLFGVLGAVIQLSDYRVGPPIEQPELILPPVVLESDSDVAGACRGLMDIVWQAGGWSGQPTS